ncbi:MAG: hypothetical protein ACOC1K_02130 [Nanoarchaeota archaeon]
MRPCPFCGFDEGWTYPYTEDDVFIPKINLQAKFRVVCVVCGSEGPPAVSREGAEKKWNGSLAKIDDNEKFLDALAENKREIWQQESKNHQKTDELMIPLLKEFSEEQQLEDVGGADLKLNQNELDENVGGVSAPMSTVANTPGVGNAQPASQAAMTGSQQGSQSSIGSGDKWDNSMGPYTRDGKTKKKAKKTKKTLTSKPIKKKTPKKVQEQNINPHDKIGVMMAKKMGVPLPFEKGKGKKEVTQVKTKEGSHKIMDYTSYSNLYKKTSKE